MKQRLAIIILTMLGLAAYQLTAIWRPEIVDQAVSPSFVVIVSLTLLALTAFQRDNPTP